MAGTQLGLHRLAAEQVNQRVGRRVVADRDHHRRQRVDRHRGTLRPILHPAAGEGARVQRHYLIPSMLACLDRAGERGQDVELERRTDRQWLVGVQRQQRLAVAERCVERADGAGQRFQIGQDLRRAVVDRLKLVEQQPLDKPGLVQHHRPAADRAFEADGDRRAARPHRLDRFDCQRRAELLAQLRVDLRQLFGRHLREERLREHLLGRLGCLQHGKHIGGARFDHRMFLRDRLGGCGHGGGRADGESQR